VSRLSPTFLLAGEHEVLTVRFVWQENQFVVAFLAFDDRETRLVRERVVTNLASPDTKQMRRYWMSLGRGQFLTRRTVAGPPLDFADRTMARQPGGVPVLMDATQRSK
jgi:hypothetical protein